MVTHRLQAECRTGSVRWPETGVLPTVLRNHYRNHTQAYLCITHLITSSHNNSNDAYSPSLTLLIDAGVFFSIPLTGIALLAPGRGVCAVWCMSLVRQLTASQAMLCSPLRSCARASRRTFDNLSSDRSPTITDNNIHINENSSSNKSKRLRLETVARKSAFLHFCQLYLLVTFSVLLHGVKLSRNKKNFLLTYLIFWKSPWPVKLSWQHSCISIFCDDL